MVSAPGRAYRAIAGWFLSPRTDSRVWISFFKYQGWVRVELTNDQVVVGWARYYSNDPGDSLRELILEGVRYKVDQAWVDVPFSLYLDSGQLRSVLRAPTRAAIEEADRRMSAAPSQPNVTVSISGGTLPSVGATLVAPGVITAPDGTAPHPQA